MSTPLCNSRTGFFFLSKIQVFENWLHDVLKKRRANAQLLLLTFVLAGYSALSQETLVGLTSTAGPTGAGTAFSLKTTGSSFTVTNRFVRGGHNPQGNDLIRGNDGNYYGMTSSGGPNGGGTIFKMTSTGTMLFVKAFAYSEGSNPFGSLIQASDGNFYGMTNQGGASGAGTIFKITSSGVLTVIANLDNINTGGYPRGSLVQGSDGALYGMTIYGGPNNLGTIFKVTTSGTLTVVKHLSSATGIHPYGSLVQGSDGAFYGMTYQGGTNNVGTIFKVTPTGSLTVLKNLESSSTGAYPLGSFTKSSDGNLYGMTSSGGVSGYGTIFKITPGGIFSVIKNLDYASGGSPYGSLVQGSDGLLYGITPNGGTTGGGTVFKCTTSGSLTVLRQLASADGVNPYGSLYKSSDGAFYGMTYQGGTYGLGTIFKITSTGTFSVLYRLPNNGQANNPSESLVQAKDGFYYGMSQSGGANRSSGTVFKMCTSGSYTTMRSFDNTNGGNPYGSLIQGTDGVFYGMTTYGGSNSAGVIFKMTSTGNLTVLKHLSAATGTYPYGTLVQGTDGAFYGMTYNGGANNVGTIFKITSTGSFTVIKNLEYSTTGAYPYGSLVQGSDGNFYGITQSGGTSSYGTIFKVTPTGTLTVLKHLDYSNGGNSQSSLTKGADGAFYGMTETGGTSSYGTIFKITTAGTYTVLKQLDHASGGYPKGDLVQGTGGVLYGMTFLGGTYNGGTIFKITTTGTFTVLRNLNPETDGANPTGSLVIQKAGPVATSQTVSTPKNTMKKILLTGSGGTPRTYKVSTAPKNGTATITKDTLYYTPKLDYVGADSLYFTTTWGCQTSSSAKIKISVTSTTSNIQEGDLMVGVLDEEVKALSVSTMPNPSHSDFSVVIMSRSNLPVSIRVLDAMGRVVEVRRNAAGNGAVKIGGSYKPGLYYVEVMQGSERVIQKLIKTAN